MEVSIKSQLLATAYAIFFGLFLGIIYDFSRSIRVLITGSFDLKFKNNVVLKKLPLFKVICKNREEKAVKPYKIITFFTDVLFFLLIIPFVAIFVYATSSGIVRWYLFLGFGIGIVIYFLTLRRLIRPIYELLTILFRLILEYIKFPFKIALIRLNLKIKAQNEKRKIKIKKKEKNEEKKQVILYIGKIKSPDDK